MQEFLRGYAARINRYLSVLPWDKLTELVNLLTEKIHDRKQIFVFGNGGSAATSSHFVCDLAKGLVGEGQPRIKAMSLNDCVPLMTAWANDVSYESVFKEPLANYLQEGDVVIGISASGNSPNVLRAIEYANSKKAFTVGWIGMGGGKLAKLVRTAIVVESNSYEEVEDIHLIIAHMLKLALKKRLVTEE